MLDEVGAEAPALTEVLTRASDVTGEVIEMERMASRAREARRMHGRNARALDAALDRALGGLHRGLEALVKALPSDHPTARTLRTLRQTLFPAGVTAITQLPYVEQHATVTLLLDRVRDGDGAWSAAVRELALAPWFDHVAEINDAYGELLTVRRPPGRREIRAADDRAFELYAEAIVAALAFASTRDDPARWRERLMKPVRDQQSEAALYRRRRAGAPTA